MATAADMAAGDRRGQGQSLTAFVDRWIFVVMATLFIVYVLIGFVPDSFSRIAAIEAGKRPPFSPMVHVHAVLMASWLVLLLVQSSLMATGSRALHFRLGVAGMIIATAMVVAGFVLSPVVYHQVWEFVKATPDGAQGPVTAMASLADILLLQIRIGLGFAIPVAIALRSRRKNADLHKRLLFLGTLSALPASFDRMTWLPTTVPYSPWNTEFHVLFAILPLLLWDIYRHRSLRAYGIYLSIYVPLSVFVHLAWNAPGWLEFVPKLYGVS